jgi:hypothetical protein
MMQKTPNRDSILPGGRKQPAAGMTKELYRGSITSTRNADLLKESYCRCVHTLRVVPKLKKRTLAGTKRTFAFAALKSAFDP